TQVLLNLTHSSGCDYELKFKINTTNTEPAIANAFSPNGDGVNDVWDVNLSKEYKIISAGIYDRWGSLIYSPPTGHSNINWDGKKANKYVNDGIYVFLIKYQNEHEKEYILQGDIMVVK
ncbi:MAG TPA: gliding motility-associated C-terminal domain-containing protein, partial [Saprospiraceae bacterium]|nr:gliding motility-associated C-terminal domain-containing protein [Saprospiraceae bacterium]